MLHYTREFIDAIERTKKYQLSLDTPVIDTSESYYTDSNYQGIEKVLHWKYPEVLEGKLAHKCANVSFFMKPYVEKFLGTEAYLTIGYWIDGHRTLFYINDEKIEALIKNPNSNKEMGFHVWLTLPSMEIIDFTIGNSLAKYIPIPLSEYMFRNPSDLNEGFTFHPVLVGEDFLRQTGYLIES